MSRDGSLPPGVEHHHIPGNRPEDLAWDKAASTICEADLLEQCAKHREDCPRSIWSECVGCNTLMGALRDHCPEQSPSCEVFVSCELHIVQVAGEGTCDTISEDADWSACVYWNRLVNERIDNG